MMKRIRRLSAFFTAILLTAVMCSCSSGTDATGIYRDAVQKTNSLTSFDALMQITLKLKSGNEKTERQSTVTVLLDQSNKDAPVYLSKTLVKDGESGEEYESSSYYANGVRYDKSSIGEKYMQDVSAKEISSQFTNIAIDIPEQAFASCRVSQHGGCKVSTKVKPDEVLSLLNSFLGGMESNYTPVGDGGFDYDFSDVKLSFETSDEGYFTSMSVAYSASFDHAEGRADADVSINVTYNNPGQPVSVEEPVDLEEYTYYNPTAPDADDSEMQEALMNDVFAMFDDNNKRVSNFDELYRAACKKYGQNSVDSIIEVIEMFGAVNDK